MSGYKKIIIAGGTGFIGQCIVEYFKNRTEEIIILSRSLKKGKENITYAKWDGKTVGEWAKELEGTDAVINLSGKSIVCRHNKENKKLILNSRVDSTNTIGEAIAKTKQKPKVWINSSGVAIYNSTTNKAHDEYSTDFANDFMADVAKKWEAALFNDRGENTRKIALRTSIVLGKNQGALSPLSILAKFGLGGKQGNGNQCFSWVHKDDVNRIIEFMVKNENISGVINNAAPNPVTNKELMKQLRKVHKMPIGIPAPAFAIKMAAPIIGIEADFVLQSSNVVSSILPENGFDFKYNYINQAFSDLFQ